MSQRPTVDELGARTCPDGRLAVSGTVDVATAPVLAELIATWARRRSASTDSPVLDLAEVSVFTAAGVRTLLDAVARHGDIEVRTGPAVDRVLRICRVELQVTTDPSPAAPGV